VDRRQTKQIYSSSEKTGWVCFVQPHSRRKLANLQLIGKIKNSELVWCGD